MLIQIVFVAEKLDKLSLICKMQNAKWFEFKFRRNRQPQTSSKKERCDWRVCLQSIA